MYSTMNQQLDLQNFSLVPDASRAAREATLARLLVPGNIMDDRLATVCARLRERYRLFCSTCPSPQWDRGLVITPEIRCQTEIYLPLNEIGSGFHYLLQRSCRYRPFLPAVPLFSALSWPDALERIGGAGIGLDAGRLLADLAENYQLRAAFLAALFVPKRYGDAKGRYPLQLAFINSWLSSRAGGDLSLLDAACGSGEGVYELAEMFCEAGLDGRRVTICGGTVEPLELVAAAHGWFPYDSGREARYAAMIGNMAGLDLAVRFCRDDILETYAGKDLHDLVICNGLLGGPLLHGAATLQRAVRGVVERVKPGGLVLAADRFHDGWRRIVPLALLQQLFRDEGVRTVDLPEGVGGIRTG